MMDVCKACGKPLHLCEEIVAASGQLFCSDTCGSAYCKEDLTFYEHSKEYVRPEDIGIC